MNAQKTNPSPSRRAVIYCRVSDKKQEKEGSGLTSQEYRCRQYAKGKGYIVDRVFPDEITGGGDFMKRKGMVALLAYLDKRPGENYVVIFDDLKRYARDAEFHLTLRRLMMERGATRECINFNFEDSPEGKFFETIAAAQGELERAQNGRQVSQKMRARVEQGYYCLSRVPGYRYVREKGGGKILIPDEASAPLIREAMEGFAAGRFQSISEVKRFLESSPGIRRNRHGEINWQTVTDILRRPLYAGYITVEKWGIHLLPGKHEPLVSFATWRKVQDRLAGRAQAPIRKDLSADFPLRGFVACTACGHPMTAAWSKGRSARYPYYVCCQKGCTLRGKSIRKEALESAFDRLLQSLTPAPVLLKLVRAMFAECWNAQAARTKARAAAAQQEIRQAEAKIGKLVERIMATDNDSIVKAYEDQIKVLDERKAALREISAQAAAPKTSFDESFRTACAFLSNPWKLWASGRLDLQRTVLRLVFPTPLAYCRMQGFRTAETPPIFRVLDTSAGTNSKMVGVTGIEPVTPAV